jgi:hypothetical protein
MKASSQWSLGKKDAKMSGSITCTRTGCCIHVALLFVSHIAAESKVVRGKKKKSAGIAFKQCITELDGKWSPKMAQRGTQ